MAARAIGNVIPEILRQSGHVVEAQPVGNVRSVNGYDAAIIGSAIYFGKWCEEAFDFVDRFRAYLAYIPVWLFSSRPLGGVGETPSEDSGELACAIQATHAIDEKTFPGALSTEWLAWYERLITKAVHAEPGNYRDLVEIRRWASDIASVLDLGSTSEDPIRDRLADVIGPTRVLADAGDGPTGRR
jgi:menaquinone-dependent protoporphyrinogen oxidase